MSRTETHIGKLRKVDTQGLTVEEWCRKVIHQHLKDNPLSRPLLDDEEWQHNFYDIDNNYRKYVFYANDLYETFDHIEGEDEDIDIMTDNGDGTYSFVMQFYNGGTCLQECLEMGLKRLGK
jgi:hypothetical protein